MTETFQVHRNAAVRGRNGRRGAEPVTTTRVPPAAMAVALRLASGDARRIRVRADGSVLVLNRPGRAG